MQVAEIGGNNDRLFTSGWLPYILQNGAGQHECGQQRHDPSAWQNRTSWRGYYQVNMFHQHKNYILLKILTFWLSFKFTNVFYRFFKLIEVIYIDTSSFLSVIHFKSCYFFVWYKKVKFVFIPINVFKVCLNILCIFNFLVIMKKF